MSAWAVAARRGASWPVMAFTRFKALRARGMPLLCVGYILLVAVLAAFPTFIAPDEPLHIDLEDSFNPPFWQSGGDASHLLGADRLGRDQLSRMIHGARISMVVSFATVVIGGIVGLVAGLVSGYVGGWIESVIQRLVDAVMSIPIILVALAMVVALGPGPTLFSTPVNIIVIISAFIWAGYARVLRSEVLSVKEREFVLAARVIGATTPRILRVHIFPNVAPILIVIVTGTLGTVILFEAGLSFLGAGVPPPNPSWGNMVNDGRSFIEIAWWVSFFPGLAILLLVLSFNLLGDWLRDVLDPRLRGII